MENKITPLPWSFHPTGDSMKDNYSQPFGILQQGTANLVGGLFGDGRGGIDAAEANARFICQAVNNYGVLVEALQAAHDRLHSLQAYFTASNFTDRYGDADKNSECLKKISAVLRSLDKPSDNNDVNPYSNSDTK